jgi:hypothetical protein
MNKRALAFTGIDLTCGGEKRICIHAARRV